jgi:ATP-dependent Lhr-like helicase
MDYFAEPTQRWMSGAFAEPTAAQLGAWREIQAGRNALVVAPTGSGKTLAAFLAALDRLAFGPPPEDPKLRCRVLYVSPLKALGVDVERNLRAPLIGLRQEAVRAGLPEPEVRVAVRTGDTPADERRRFGTKPPDILITTPESLFLLLTSQAREALRGVETVIVDEVHAIAGTKRGAHLALSLERLDLLLKRPAQRIGLSATVRPPEEVANWLGGPRPAVVVAPPSTKIFDLKVVVPVEDMAEIAALDEDSVPAEERGRQRSSIWPHVEQRVAELIEQHTSTLVFANSRRLAERLCNRLNEIRWAELHPPEEQGADTSRQGRPPAELMGEAGQVQGVPPLLARAHHGSVSKEQRAEVEEALKAGLLPAVVATSSLELGIDMGAVDLVVQVESPPSVASGLQRVGRAGHQVGAVSRGVIFPKFRGDLVQAAVVAERMREGKIESVHAVRNPLDVLAQQIVAMVAVEPWQTVDCWRRSAGPRRSRPWPSRCSRRCSTCSRAAIRATSSPSCGPGWSGIARPGGSRAGRARSGWRSPRAGRFRTAGCTASSWWGIRSRPSGSASSTRRWSTSRGWAMCSPSARARGGSRRSPTTGCWSPRRRASPGAAVLARRRARPAARARPSPRRVHPRTRRPGSAAGAGAAAKGGPRRLGGREPAGVSEGAAGGDGAGPGRPDDPGRALPRRARRLADGHPLPLRRPGARAVGPGDRRAAARGARHGRPGHARGRRHRAARAGRGLGRGGCHGSAGGGARALRRRGDRAAGDGRGGRLGPVRLQVPRVRGPGPAAAAAQAGRAGPAVAAATARGAPALGGEQVRLVPDRAGDGPRVPAGRLRLPGLVELLGDIEARRVRIVEVETQAPSPFAKSLLFGYIAQFMYEGDSPLAERRAAALAVDPSLLAELLGQPELRDLFDNEVIEQLEAELQHLSPERHARDAEDAADLLRLLGPLSTEAAARRGIAEDWLKELERTRRAIRVRIAGEERWAAIEDAGRLRDALGCPLPVGVPEAFTEPVPDPLGDLVARYARTHAPFAAEEAAGHFGLGVAVLRATLERLAAQQRVVRGGFRPETSGEQWCDARVLRRLRRRTVAALREQAEPVAPTALARMLPAWHGVISTGSGDTAGQPKLRGVDGVLRAVEQLAGYPVPASALERLILPARVADYQPAMLDELTAGGEVSWTGAGALAVDDGWVALAPASIAPAVLPDPLPLDSFGPLHRAILAELAGENALFFRGLMSRLDEQALEETTSDRVLDALWELLWAGHLTNDTLAPLRALLGAGKTAHRAKRPTPRGRYASLRLSAPLPGAEQALTTVQAARAAGRWSRVRRLSPTASTTPSQPKATLAASSPPKRATTTATAEAPPLSATNGAQPTTGTLTSNVTSSSTNSTSTSGTGTGTHWHRQIQHRIRASSHPPNSLNWPRSKPRCCWTATAWSRVVRSARNVAGSAHSGTSRRPTACSRPSKRSGGYGAATSWTGSAPHSSRRTASWIGCARSRAASAGERTRQRQWCSPPRTRRTRTAPPWIGHIDRLRAAARPTTQRSSVIDQGGRRAPWSCSMTGNSPGTSNAADVRS